MDDCNYVCVVTFSYFEPGAATEGIEKQLAFLENDSTFLGVAGFGF